MTRHIILAKRGRDDIDLDHLVDLTGCEFLFITEDSKLTANNIDIGDDGKIFVTHWSHMIPKAIYEKNDCIVFHMTDLPFGRGGSPLQNLIVRGYDQTNITAFRCTGERDAGPVYMKRPLSLEGSAKDIYSRAYRIISDMIVDIIKENPQPKPQSGEVVTFVRRKPEDGDISELKSAREIYDYIRMLDAEGYPKAFLNHNRLHLEFSEAKVTADYVDAHVRIFVKKGGL